MIDKSRLLVGKPIEIAEGVFLHSPTVDEVTSLGESGYAINFILCSFDKRSILVDLFGISEKEFDEFNEFDSYRLLTEHPSVRDEICQALSFFVHDRVEYSEEYSCFSVNETSFIDNKNYKQFVKILRIINGRVEEEKSEEKPKFANKIAEEMYKQMMKLKLEADKLKAKKGLEFKDTLSILCNSDGNGINVFNVKQLTVYQVYEQFERMSLKENYHRTIPVWANGYFDTKKNKFPEWIVQTKL